jgi:hypothetical protein
MMDGYSKRQHCQRTGPGFDVIDLDSEAGSMPSTKPVPGVNRCEALVQTGHGLHWSSTDMPGDP